MAPNTSFIHTVRQYLVELEQQNPTDEPVHEQKLVSTTNPDATYATKGGTPARLGYYDNYLVDNQSCVIVGVQATAARMSQETVVFKFLAGERGVLVVANCACSCELEHDRRGIR